MIKCDVSHYSISFRILFVNFLLTHITWVYDIYFRKNILINFFISSSFWSIIIFDGSSIKMTVILLIIPCLLLSIIPITLSDIYVVWYKKKKRKTTRDFYIWFSFISLMTPINWLKIMMINQQVLVHNFHQQA